jgi:hypothetical protein
MKLKRYFKAYLKVYLEVFSLIVKHTPVTLEKSVLHRTTYACESQ